MYLAFIVAFLQNKIKVHFYDIKEDNKKKLVFSNCIQLQITLKLAFVGYKVSLSKTVINLLALKNIFVYILSDPLAFNV